MLALRELKLLYVMGVRDDLPPDSTSNWIDSGFHLRLAIMLGCPFRLKAFRTGRHTDDMIWLRQNQIRDCNRERLMDKAPQTSGTQTYLALLPHISIGHVSNTCSNAPPNPLIFRTIPGRQLTRLRLDMDGNDGLTDTVAALAPVTDLREESTHSQILQNVSKLFPNLDFLFYVGMPELGGPQEVDFWQGFAFPQALSPFKHLSMFGVHSAYLDIHKKHSRR
ncbi:hypothetical protein FIBSPDRAFT_882038 [Athelia psychrophila]|uniref:Uncharacterized protein n=1 Tax=Athelia psychrophila TaxID=1759441 RepID=A0A166W1J7_9AGAM|nr:hypothetical protein FIBSPDRAFT_882038 [Fibularhizoctonia sp. CBS 109695]